MPGSINSKYKTEVTIIQKWNGYRPRIRLLIGDFHAYSIDNKNKREREIRKSNQLKNNDQTITNTIPWIEKLIETPIEDGRKYTLWKILCPYLVNIRKLEYEESFEILKTWLQKCNDLRRLDFNHDIEIKAKLRYVKNYKPISIKGLKEDNRKLFFGLKFKIIALK
jgi:Primase X